MVKDILSYFYTLPVLVMNAKDSIPDAWNANRNASSPKGGAHAVSLKAKVSTRCFCSPSDWLETGGHRILCPPPSSQSEHKRTPGKRQIFQSGSSKQNERKKISCTTVEYIYLLSVRIQVRGGISLCATKACQLNLQ